MDKKLLIIIVIVIVISTVSFSRSFLGVIGVIPWHYGYSDVFNEDRINTELAKRIPYVESPVEYPIITGFFIYLMWFLGKNLFGYAILTWLFLTLAAVITATTLYQLCDLLNVDKKRLVMFFAFAPSLLVFGIYNWDIIAVMFMVLAIHFFYRDQYVLSSMFLGLGFNAKLFPIVILPIMLLKTNLKQGIKIILMFLVTFLFLNLYFVINDFDMWKITYTFHGSRAPNIDSIWALTHLGIGTINIMSMLLFLIAYISLVSYHKKYDVISLSFASLLLFFLFNKVFSPQYMLWVLPFFVLSQTIAIKVFYSLEFANIAVFLLIQYWIFVSEGQIVLMGSILFIVMRGLLLAYLLYFILVKTRYNYDIEKIKTNINNE